MFGNNIYQKENPALVGGSPQQVYEQLWSADSGKRKRKRVRGSVVAFGAGYVFGLFVGGLAVYWAIVFVIGFLAYDAAQYAKARLESRIWRTGDDGASHTAKALRGLELAGRGEFTVLHRRFVPGHGVLPHLVAARGQVWIVENQVHAPDIVLASVKGRLFFGKDVQSHVVAKLEALASTVSEALSQEMGGPVKASVVVAVHGGRAKADRMTAGGVVLMRTWRVPLWIRAAHAEHGDADAPSAQDISQTAQRLFGPGGR
ncbi:hypothetical protein LO762_27075 [Actinocorallia sp. API 0066]|uniref:hypothetical protein n=1 Tax=Actinocorallia sp. API 0066 TaxID=2896846 RepID=UPI001E4EC612|nr:hypothetical protein [Actinocorallia sp. API 0066]MCD0452817.1 hypothetical protein [Actinocorallia sp. API 0066]